MGDLHVTERSTLRYSQVKQGRCKQRTSLPASRLWYPTVPSFKARHYHFGTEIYFHHCSFSRWYIKEVIKKLARSRTMTRVRAAAPDRTVIGPLTTTFTPPTECATPFDLALPATKLGLGLFYWDCNSKRSCFPGRGRSLATNVPGGFYSPGLYCPEGWETAATIDSRTPKLYSSLLPGETAAICCPR
jgi:hypothetical protein